MKKNRTIMDVHRWISKDDIVYFKAFTAFPGTYSYDMQTDKLMLLKDEECNYELEQLSYFQTLEYKEKLIFLPYYTENRLCIYDTEKCMGKYYPVEGREYRSGLVINDKVYAVSSDLNTVKGFFVFDLNTEEILYPFKVPPMITVNQYSNIVASGNYLFVTTKKEDTLLRINIKDFSYELIKISGWGYRYSTIIEADEKMILTGDFDYIVVWDKKDSCTRYELPINKGEVANLNWKGRFSDNRIVNGKVIFSPLYYRSLIQFDISSNQVDVIYEVEDNSVVTWGINQYKDNLYIAISTPENLCKGYIVYNTVSRGVSSKTLFDLNEHPEVDLCFMGREYSKQALKTFLDSLVRESTY